MSQHFDQTAYTEENVNLPVLYCQAVNAYEQSLNPCRDEPELDEDGEPKWGKRWRKGWREQQQQNQQQQKRKAEAEAAAEEEVQQLLHVQEGENTTTTNNKKAKVDPHILCMNRFKRLTGDEGMDNLLRSFDREFESAEVEEVGSILEKQRLLEKHLLEIHAEFEQTKFVDETQMKARGIKKRRNPMTTRSMTAGVAAALTFQFMKGKPYVLPGYASVSIRKMASENKPGALAQAWDFINNRLRFRDIPEGSEEKARFAEEVLDFKLYYWYENLMAKAKKYGVWHEQCPNLTESRLMGIYYRHYRVLLMIHPKIESVRKRDF